MLENLKERVAAVDWNTAAAVLIIMLVIIPLAFGLIRKVA